MSAQHLSIAHSSWTYFAWFNRTLFLYIGYYVGICWSCNSIMGCLCSKKSDDSNSHPQTWV